MVLSTCADRRRLRGSPHSRPRLTGRSRRRKATDRLRLGRGLHPAGRRHLALVPQAPRPRHGRSAPRGNYIGGAAWPKVTDVLMRTATTGAPPTWSIAAICLVGMLPLCLVLRPRSPAHSRRRSGGASLVARARSLAQRPAGLARHRRHRLLRRHGDAAGPYRRLLRRPRLWHRARRGDAVDHDGVRHREPARLGLDRRPDRRPQDPAAGLDRCRRCRCSATSCRTGWSGSTSCRRCSACSRAASSRATA